MIRCRTGSSGADTVDSSPNLLDVLELSRIRQRAVLPRLSTRLARQTAGLLNMADAARSAGVSTAVEVKASSRVDGADARGLRGLADRLPDTWVGGVVFHLGTQAFTLDGNRALYAVPVSGLWAPT